MALPDPEIVKQQYKDSQSNGLKNTGTEDGERLTPVYAFDLDVEGEHGKRWTGSFVFRVPTVGQKIEIGHLKSTFLPNGSVQGIGSETLAAGFAEMVAYLSITLTKYPDWWKPLDMYDPNPLAEVFKEAIEYEHRFHGRDTVDGDDQVRAGSGERSGGDDPTDVGRKVRKRSKRSTIIESDSQASG